MKRAGITSAVMVAWAIMFTASFAFAGAAERAMKAAKALAKKAPAGTTLTIMQVTATKAQWAPAAKTWEKETGIPVKFVELNFPDTYVKGMQEAVAKSGTWDIITSLTDFIADFASAGLAAELNGWMKKHDPEWGPGGGCGVLWPLHLYGNVRGKYYGWMTDGDIWLLFLRKDLLTDPKEKAAFKKKYGYDLAIPKTWKEYGDQVAFFDRPPNLRGAWLFRNKNQMSNEFFIRFYQKGGKVFDADMNPTFNSAIGVSVVEEMNALNKNMDTITITGDWSVLYSQFPGGKTYSAMAWPSLGAFTLFPNSKTKGKIVAALPPATVVNGKRVQTSAFVSGYGAIVSRHSKNPELAYLFLQYVNSPKMSLEGITQPGAFDPFRSCHFKHKPIAKKYPDGELEVIREAIPVSAPPLLLRGFNELMNSLSISLNSSAVGKLTAKEALDEAAKNWAKTIKRYGKKHAREQWAVIQNQFPKVIQGLWK